MAVCRMLGGVVENKTAEALVSKKPTHYEALGVPKEATADQIKRAFRKRASQAHPDKGGKEEDMVKLNAAWACLGDPQRRLTYDNTGHDGEGPSVELRGQLLLMELFDRVLNEGNAEGLLHKVRSMLMAQNGEFAQSLRSINSATAALTKARNKVRKKKGTKGTNIYNLLVDARLHHLTTARTDCLRKQEDFNSALALLDDYEQDVSPVPDYKFSGSIFTAI